MTLIAVMAAFLIPVVLRARDRSNLARCADHLRNLGVELRQYAASDHGMLPISPAIDGSQLTLTRALPAVDPQNFYCPALTDSHSAGSENHFRTGVIGYYYYSAMTSGGDPRLSKFLRLEVTWPRKLSLSMGPRTWVMSDIWMSAVPTAHTGYRKGVNYLMLDGSVGFLTGSPRQSFH